MIVRRLTNADPSFYTLMGPYLSRRDIVSELGGPVWDDDGKVWFVALTKHRVVGFCARIDSRAGSVFGSDYVIPEHRKKSVYSRLFDARLEDTPAGTKCRATVTDDSLPTYLANGFEVKRTRGRFTIVGLVK